MANFAHIPPNTPPDVRSPSPVKGLLGAFNRAKCLWGVGMTNFCLRRDLLGLQLGLAANLGLGFVFATSQSLEGYNIDYGE
jgi:hypothetical protein